MAKMENRQFNAFVVSAKDDKAYKREITTRTIDDLPEGDVIVRVSYSSLNYKDALSAIGNKGVTRHYPHTPGIDAAGVVAKSENNALEPGDEVIVTSYDLGMDTDGGFAEYIRVPADWVVRRPDGLTLKEAMIYGTAGFTAGLSVNALVQEVKPEDGEVLVTGASGGVGSMAVSILTKMGYQVAAVEGMTEDRDYLSRLGVKEIISRDDAVDTSGRPILKARWAGVIDSLGGEILATAIKSTKLGGTVTCCGNAASGDLPLTVYPFILRGVRLVGIDSQHCAMPLRKNIWEKLAGDWKLDGLADMATDIGMADLNESIEQMLQGRSQGRKVVKVTG